MTLAGMRGSHGMANSAKKNQRELSEELVNFTYTTLMRINKNENLETMRKKRRT